MVKALVKMIKINKILIQILKILIKAKIMKNSKKEMQSLMKIKPLNIKNLIPSESLPHIWQNMKKPELSVYELSKFLKMPPFTLKLVITWILIHYLLLKKNLLRKNYLLLLGDIYLMEAMNIGKLINLKHLIEFGKLYFHF